MTNSDFSDFGPFEEALPTDSQSDQSDQSALEELYERYFHSLVRGLRQRYGSGPPDPDDIAQQTFARLQSRGNLADIDNLQSFAWITANNIAHSELRSLRVRERNVESEIASFWGTACDELDPERVISAREELEIVVATISAMPKRRREIFLACRFHGLTPEQAGKQSGVSRSSAVRHVAVASASLIAALASHHSAQSSSKGGPLD